MTFGSLKGIVVTPCHNRPEFLAATIKRIAMSRGWGDYLYWFFLDEGFDDRNWTVIANAFSEDVFGPVPYRISASLERKYPGNSYNIMLALSRALDLAYEKNVQIVHLIEDDIFVGQDYFRFHEQAHKQFKPWVVSSCRNQQLRVEPPVEPDSVYHSQNFQGLGLSFSLEALEEIAAHCNNLYFSDPNGYCSLMFPESKLRSLFTDWDGVCTRIIEAGKRDVIYPFQPRSFHAGFIGLHRNGVLPEGSLEERIDALEQMTEAEMNRATDVKDIRHCHLGYIEPNELVMKDLTW